MRVKFRILLYKGDKPLSRKDIVEKQDPLSLGIRYILEYKYIEASKWLLLAEDSEEKYTLLALISLALGQRETAQEFITQSKEYPKKTDIKILLSTPEISKPVEANVFFKQPSN